MNAKYNVTFVLKVKPEANSGFVQCTITTNGEKIRFSLGAECSRIPTSLWDTRRNRPKGTTLDALSIRQRMEQAEQIVASAFEEGRVSLGTVKALVLGQPISKAKGKQPESVAVLFSRYLNAQEDELSTGTRKAYRTSERAFIQYEVAVGDPLTIAGFRAGTPQQADAAETLERDLYRWLVKGYGYNDNTASRALGHLSAVLAWHERTGRGGAVRLHTSFKYRKTIAALEPIALTSEEVLLLESVELSKDTPVWHARNLFVLGCHCGLRFSDWIQLDPAKWREPFQVVVQGKTGDTTKVLHTEGVRRILRLYKSSGWPAFMRGSGANVYLNRLVKDAALTAGLTRSVTVGTKRLGKAELTTRELWQEISTHTARRTFTTSRLLAGDSLLDVAQRTGHRTLAMLKTYDRTTAEQLASKFGISTVTSEEDE